MTDAVMELHVTNFWIWSVFLMQSNVRCSGYIAKDHHLYKEEQICEDSLDKT